MPFTTKFKNCKLLRNHEILNEILWVQDGKVIDAQKKFYAGDLVIDVEIDLSGLLVAPGFIDIQINGGFGIDFSNNVEDVEGGLGKVAKGLLAHGVTAFCPTVVTSPPELYRQVLPKLGPKEGGTQGATVLGAHVEGPFINVEKKGAHNPNHIERALRLSPRNVLNECYGSLENIRILTLAPELDLCRNEDLIKTLHDRNIVVSLGHSNASLNTGEEAALKGARLITHLFNAMLPFHHRDPGLVGLLASDTAKEIFYGIIADGVHTHPAALKIAHRTHPKGLVLVTDAVSAMGLPNGTHHIGDLEIQVRPDGAYIKDTNTLCGSIATMDKCVQFFAKTGNVIDALECASLHPAQALFLDSHKGHLNFGADADFVVLDDDLNVLSTWIAGQCVYVNNN